MPETDHTPELVVVISKTAGRSHTLQQGSQKFIRRGESRGREEDKARKRDWSLGMRVMGERETERAGR